MAEVPNSLMLPSQKELCLLLAMRALSPSAHPTLRHPQLPHRRLVGAGALNLFAGGQGGKVVDPQIQANSGPPGGGNRRGTRDNQRKARVPSSCHPADGYRADRGSYREGKMPLDPGVTNALEGEATIAEAPAKVPRQAVIPPGRAKARIPRLCPRFDPAEEGSKGPIESEKWVPHRRTAHPVRPHTCSPNVRQLTKLFVKGHRTAQHSPGVATLLERRIVELARE